MRNVLNDLSEHCSQSYETLLRPRFRTSMVLVFALVVSSCQQSAVNSADGELWTKLYQKAAYANKVGDVETALPAAQQAYDLAKKIFGPEDGKTLNSLTSLAELYFEEGRYREAEPLFKEAIQLRRESHGNTHPNTLIRQYNLAVLYRAQGRYGEAETHFEQVSKLRRETLGETHPDTLTSLNSLAGNYLDQGRYGKAETHYKQSLNLRREALGETHPDTLTSLNNLADLYTFQKRFDEAATLYKQVLKLRRETLGETHPATLSSLHGLAKVDSYQGRFSLAEQPLKQIVKLRSETLGETHPNTLASVVSLANLYHDQGRFGEAEKYYERVLKLRLKTLGESHPDTLWSMNTLAAVQANQGRYQEAAPHYERALELRRETLGETHPATLKSQLDLASVLVKLNRVPDAITMLGENGTKRLSYAESELANTESANTRKLLLDNQSGYQDFVISLALQHMSTETVTLAGNVMLSWKKIRGSEDALLAHLLRTEDNSSIQDLAKEVTALRARLARTTQSPDPNQNPVVILKELEAKELALSRLSDSYKQQRGIRHASLDRLEAALPKNTGVIEFRQYHPIRSRIWDKGEPSFAALLVRPNLSPILVDAGPLDLAKELLQDLRAHNEPARVKNAEVKLYRQLFSGFNNELEALEKVYIAPDGLLHMVPFEQLRSESGEYFGEEKALRFVPTSRELLIEAEEKESGLGLLALGGIDFGSSDQGIFDRAKPDMAAVDQQKIASTRDQLRSLFEDFEQLKASHEEVVKIAKIYQQQRPDDTVTIWTGDIPTEARLKAMDGLSKAPRVLHIATHGFYLPTAHQTTKRQQLYSGLVLAGANSQLKLNASKVDPDTDDGILYSLEAQDLNLEGTELVVLSACDTGKGVVDYSEGVVGMVRALRIAGAKQILMTLWPVLDKQTAVFMEAFYSNWLNHPNEDPAEALAQTKHMFRTHENPDYRRPLIWAPFVIIGV